MSFLSNNRTIILEQLTKILFPLIYQGLESIYGEAVGVSQDNPKSTLKNFQLFLKKVPEWSPQIVEQEKRRIMLKLEEPMVLEGLVRCYLKLTIVQLTGYNKTSIIKTDNMNEVNIGDILHKIYIDIARDLYSNPFLMYDKLSPIEVKKNQNMVLDIIKNSIKISLEASLPWEEITSRILEMPELDLLPKHILQPTQVQPTQVQPTQPAQPKQFSLLGGGTEDLLNKMITPSKLGPKKESELPNVNSHDKKILDIIDNATKKTTEQKILQKKSETEKKEDGEKKEEKEGEKKGGGEKKEYGEKKEEKKEEVDEKVIELGKKNGQIDTASIKNMMKDLKVSDTSISHVPATEDNFSGYADVFTNKNINTEEKTKKLSKNKFFANYLKV